MIRTLVLLLCVMVVSVARATPAGDPADLDIDRRGSADKPFVALHNKKDFCMILPRVISQSPSGAPVVTGNKTYCTPNFGTSRKHGTLPSPFGYLKFVHGTSPQGHRFVKLTGCITKGLPPPFNDLNVVFPAGARSVRFDSDGRGHPQGSMCIGYKNYVEVINPRNNGQVCLKCCDDPKGCSDTNDPSEQDNCYKVVQHAYYCS